MIKVSNLTKYYGDHLAVDDISFEIKDGTVCGFLGPNGAGKSTTMNIMTGCLSATAGSVSINGHDIFEEPIEAKKQIGYLPEMPPVYTDETVTEYLRFVARAKGVPAAQIPAEIENAIKETQLEEVAGRLIKHLSKGYRQRVGIAQTLLGSPSVIILDEPTVGLDPLQVIDIRNLIQSLGRTHTVILSSHILSEVQMICDEIIIISGGRLIAYDTSENLEKLMSPTAMIELITDADESESRSVLDKYNDVESAEYVETKDDSGSPITKIHIKTKPDSEYEIRRTLSLEFAKLGRAVLGLSSVKANLEEIFIELTSSQDEAATEAEVLPVERAEEVQE